MAVDFVDRVRSGLGFPVGVTAADHSAPAVGVAQMARTAIALRIVDMVASFNCLMSAGTLYRKLEIAQKPSGMTVGRSRVFVRDLCQTGVKFAVETRLFRQ